MANGGPCVDHALGRHASFFHLTVVLSVLMIVIAVVIAHFLRHFALAILLIIPFALLAFIPFTLPFTISALIVVFFRFASVVPLAFVCWSRGRVSIHNGRIRRHGKRGTVGDD